LLNGTTEEKIYKVKQGDSLWLIAKNNNMTVEEIIQANPEINPTIIHIGDEINLVVPKPYLNVEVTYLHTYTQNIPYQIKIKKDSNLARIKWKIIESGKIGEKEVITEVITKNGLLENRKIIDEKIITQPQTRIIVQGAK
jgi:spore germination protein YaaH